MAGWRAYLTALSYEPLATYIHGVDVIIECSDPVSQERISAFLREILPMALNPVRFPTCEHFTYDSYTGWRDVNGETLAWALTDLIPGSNAHSLLLEPFPVNAASSDALITLVREGMLHVLYYCLYGVFFVSLDGNFDGMRCVCVCVWWWVCVCGGRGYFGGCVAPSAGGCRT